MDQSISDYIKQIKSFDAGELAQIVQAITFKIVRKAQEPLVELCYEKGIKPVEIARKLNVSRQAIEIHFPKGGKK